MFYCSVDFVRDCPGEPVPEGKTKTKTSLDFLEQETVSGSGISWVTCKSAPHPKLITTPTPTTQFFYGPDAIPATQPTASEPVS